MVLSVAVAKINYKDLGLPEESEHDRYAMTQSLRIDENLNQLSGRSNYREAQARFDILRLSRGGLEVKQLLELAMVNLLVAVDDIEMRMWSVVGKFSVLEK
jgi:hypothetical protein